MTVIPPVPSDPDEIALAVEAAIESEDLAGLRRLADAGSTDAEDALVELAAERGDLEELRRLAAAGNTDAADELLELEEEEE
ncbi:hypothetical protein KNO15_08095 [Leifsonia shinshuensis]|uniref:hypothetical protein n=1 Tax=Leifsonia shinshuensis TaxID=150026 RepID=UPI001F511878|nr:hypothetical protein [Leifsonia shinshuensis]MCI0156656.1 hypothetical protein [Leifsonia shinshuensis]